MTIAQRADGSTAEHKAAVGLNVAWLIALARARFASGMDEELRLNADIRTAQVKLIQALLLACADGTPLEELRARFIDPVGRESPGRATSRLPPVSPASQRLRGRPGRPQTKPSGDNPGDSREPQRTQVRVPPARPAARTQDSPSCAPPGPRLLTRQQAADYLNLSPDMLDRLTQQGELPRVQLALGNRNIRKVLYDRADLDRLVELSRIV